MSYSRMGEKTFEDGGQNVSGIETNPSIDKPIEGIYGKQNSDSNIACVTPEKADEYLKGKLKEEGIKLQEKWVYLLDAMSNTSFVVLISLCLCRVIVIKL